MNPSLLNTRGSYQNLIRAVTVICDALASTRFIKQYSFSKARCIDSKYFVLSAWRLPFAELLMVRMLHDATNNVRRYLLFCYNNKISNDLK